MSTVTFGTKVERLIIDKLNKNGIKAVLAPNRVMRGIDGLIIKDRYTSWPIQIKARKNLEDGEYVPSIKDFYSDFFIIAYSKNSNKFWVIPKNIYKKISNVSENRLSFTKKNMEILRDYENMKGINYIKNCLKKR
jgi:hypothetical protein